MWGSTGLVCASNDISADDKACYVTVKVTLIVCPLPEIVTPALSVAAIVMVPEYVPGSRFAGFTLTPNVLPLPLSVPDVAGTSQALLADAVQLTGRTHVPVSLKVTFCTVDEDCPSRTENARLAGKGDDSTQGGRTVSVTAKV